VRESLTDTEYWYPSSGVIAVTKSDNVVYKTLTGLQDEFGLEKP
jgi:hypothetical protein